ncbi:MAG: hypothetical protein I3J03_00715, partial [Actinomyces succiniciruminis]|nr:hypothetical protein [Actinomyces succiniciruminis]
KIAALIAVFCLALLAPPSQAATTADEQALRDWLTSYGVPSELQQYTIDKVKNDETLDADKEGSVPIITEDRTSGTSIIHVKIYADGSFTADQEYTASSQAMNYAGVGIQSVSGCTYKSAGSAAWGGYWTNCRAEHANTYGKLFVRVNYENTPAYGSRITNFWGAGGNATYGGGSFRAQRVSANQILVLGEFNGYTGQSVYTKGMYVTSSGSHLTTSSYH